MTNDEEHLRRRLRRWQLEDPADDLVDRIVAHAITLPQQRSLALRLQRLLMETCCDWRLGLSYKLACLLLCALIGFGSGLRQQPQATVDVSVLIMGDNLEAEQ